MSIWFGTDTPDLAAATASSRNTAITNLGIEFTGTTDDALLGRMPVDERTRQPGGVLHGGASVLFAETLCSWASSLTVDPAKHYCVGMEINANHLRPVASGWVYGAATPISRGRTTQVWEIRITNEEGKLVCIARCTMAVLSEPSKY